MRIQATSIYRLLTAIAIIAIVLSGCTDTLVSFAGDTNGTPGTTVSLAITLPESTRAQAKGFDIVTIHVTASHDTLADVTAEMSFDDATSSWIGAVEGLANGDWTFLAEAVDESEPPIILFSGTIDFTIDAAAASNTVTIDMYEHSGVAMIDVSWADAGTVDTVRVTANRDTFPAIITEQPVFPDELSTRVYTANLANGDWEIVIEGLYKGAAYSAATEPTVTIASVASVTTVLTQTVVTPVEFSSDPFTPQPSEFALELTCATDVVDIYYTDDGTDPTSSGTVILYTEPFDVAGDTTIRAIAEKVDLDPSPESTGAFVIARAEAGKFSASYNHAALIRSDGTLWTWGYNYYGQLGHGDTVNRDVPTQVGTDTDWLKVSTGYEHTLALKNDGSLWSWGENGSGQLGHGTTSDSYTPVQEPLGYEWIDIAAGYSHSLAVTADYRLYGWGSQYNGKLGNGYSSGTISVPSQYKTDTPDTDWEKVYAGDEYSMAIKTDGTLWAFGDNNYYGMLGVGDENDRWWPEQVGTLSWQSVSIRTQHSAGIQTDGTLWAWGSNSNGKLGLGNTTEYHVPQQIAGSWVGVSVASDHTIAVDSSGLLWVWGDGDSPDGSLGTYNEDQLVPAQIGSDTDWVDVVAAKGSSHASNIALKTDGSLWSFGWNDYGILGDGQGFDTHRYSPSRVGTGTNWKTVEAGNDHSIALTTTGEIWGWGENYDGQLGTGDNIDKYSPTRAGSDSDWMTIAGGGEFGAALKDDGTLYTWGENAKGQLAHGTSAYTDELSPKAVLLPVGATWSSIATGYASLFAIRSDAGHEGELWAAGWNFWGALGNGNGEDQYILVQITEDTDWKMVSGGYQHTAALKTNGTLWVWGHNASKQLGEATTADHSSIPIQLGSDTDWDEVYAGEYYTLAKKTDGSLWAWGTGWNGAHGLGPTGAWYRTGRVGTDFGWQIVSACDADLARHAIGIRDNRLYGWGLNSFSELGTGTDVVNGADETIYDIRLIDPKPVWDTISTGRGHSLGIQLDGSLWAWGYNAQGQIAVPCYNNSYSNPVQLEPVRVVFP